MKITWFVPVAQSASGSCQPGVSTTTVPSAGIWKVEIGGGGGAAGLALQRGSSPVNGSGGPGALLTVRVFLAAGQGLEAVVGCNGFSGNGGRGFSKGADGGCSGRNCKPQGGGGGGSSALCLEGPDANSCSPSIPACTSSVVPLQKGQACVLVVAGGGGGGGTGSDTLSCKSPGWTGGAGGVMPTSSPDKSHGGTVLPGGNDGDGHFGGSSGSPNGEFTSPSDGYAGSGGGGGGWPSGGGADGWWMNASKCGGGGGDSWYSGLTQLVGAVPNTCEVKGAVSNDCPGFLRMTSVPGPKATRLATRPAVPDDTVW